MDDEKRFMLLSLANRIYKSNWPEFTCSYCKKDLQKITNLNYNESKESSLLHEHEAWEPEWISGGFAAVSTCQNCKEKAYIAGSYSLEETYNEDETGMPHPDYVEVFSISYITPAVSLLDLPKNSPELIKKYMDTASDVIFISPELAANRIRSSLDVLLTEQKIPRFKVIKGKRTRLSTHRRIKLFADSNSEVGGLLEAVKWIGNEGTHGADLTFNDVIDGLEIYSLALNLIYNRGTKAIIKKAKLINKNRGTVKGSTPF